MDKETAEARVSVADAEAVLGRTGNAVPTKAKNSAPDDPWLGRVGAAAFFAKYADEEGLAANAVTLDAIFHMALSDGPPEINLRYDLMFDPEALAIAGVLYLAVRRGGEKRLTDLMATVVAFPRNAAAVFHRYPGAGAKLDPSTLRSLVRLGLQACIFVRRQGFDEDREAFTTREAALIAEQCEGMAAERAWLGGSRGEPNWPVAPPRRELRPKRPIPISGEDAPEVSDQLEPVWPDRYFDDQTAAVWANVIESDPRLASSAGRELFFTNVEWLIAMNQPGQGNGEGSDPEGQWEQALFEIAAVGAMSWSESEQQQWVYDVLNQFSDGAFVDAAATFLVKSDLLHIERGDKDRAYLLRVRERLWSRLKKTIHWKRHILSSRTGMDIHLKELIATIFFKVSSGFGREISYTKGLEGQPLLQFMPLLTEIAMAAPACPTIAHFYLDCVEIVGGDAAMAHLLQTAQHWVVEGNDRFWGELGIGRRVCILALQIGVKATPEAWVPIGDRAAGTGLAEGEELKRSAHAALLKSQGVG